MTREHGVPGELLRLGSLPDGTVVPDPKGRLGARGAWVRADAETIRALMARPAPLARAWEREVTPAQVAGLLDEARAGAWRSVLDLLSLTARAGALQSGAEQVAPAMRSGRCVALLSASDASPRSVEDAGAGSTIPCFSLPLDKAALGQRIGKGPRALAAVLRSAPGDALVRQLRLYDQLR